MLYASALRQFEDLLTSAEAAGYAGRPVPLFDALSQAGRAIVAAFGDAPTVGGHGLKEHRIGDADVGLLERQIDRAPFKDGTDAFGAVAAAIGSPVFTGSASLGAIWAATPGASDFLQCDWQNSWCPPLLACLGLRDERVGVSVYRTNSQVGRVIAPDEIRGARYARIPDTATIEDSWGFGVYPADTHVATASWITPTAPRRKNCADAWHEHTPMCTPTPSCSRRSTTTATQCIADVVVALLFALSVFARYHPTTWVSALELDQSELAVPLQALLDVAPDAVAGLIWEVLSPRIHGRSSWVRLGGSGCRTRRRPSLTTPSRSVATSVATSRPLDERCPCASVRTRPSIRGDERARDRSAPRSRTPRRDAAPATIPSAS